KLRLAADGDLEPPVVPLVDLSDVAQQGQDGVPLHVVAGRVLENLSNGVAVVVVEAGRVCHWGAPDTTWGRAGIAGGARCSYLPATHQGRQPRGIRGARGLGRAQRRRAGGDNPLGARSNALESGFELDVAHQPASTNGLSEDVLPVP